MRLTLRTLLAWLDDTLPPAEVRQIGQQVAETPLAQELVDRIHRVTRQRRLTVPSGSGPDGVDAATVAAYIDDGLEADEVVDFEKRCLTSDVHLSEVASVHQILSLLAQKAKVPPEARERMYHLIKGREAVGPSVPRTFKPPKPAPEPSEFAAWGPEPAPKPRLVERYGPAAIVVALCLVLVWSAYMNLGPARDATPKDVAVAGGGDKPAVVPAVAEKPEDAPPPEVEAPKVVEKPAPPETPPPAPEVPAPPPGSVGLVGKIDGIMVRYNPDTTSKWDRLAPLAPLREDDRIVNLPPYASPVQVGSVKLTMVGDGELVPLKSNPGTAGRFELRRGRVRIVGTSPDPIGVPFDSGVLKLTVPPGAVVGLERVNHRTPGDKLPSAPALRVSVAEGEATVEAGTSKETLSAGSTLVFHAPDQFSAKEAGAVPPWASEAEPSAAQQERGRLLAQYFKPDKSPKTSVVEAAEDKRPEVCRDAITAFAALDLLDLLVATMSTQIAGTENAPVARKAAIAGLRDVAMRDADSAKLLRGKLEQIGGSKAWADLVEGFLIGAPQKDAAGAEPGSKLVGLLKHEDVGIRELALEALMTLAHRGDSLGYDPDKPTEGNGLKNWQELVQRHEIPNAPAKAK